MNDISREHLASRLQAVAARDQAALREVYELTSAKLFGVCLRILATREEAEDVLQEVYVNVWNRAASFDPARSSPITWLAAIARNKAIDRLRALGPRTADRPLPEDDSIADGAMDALSRLEHSEQHQRLRACLDELEQRTRTAIVAAFYGGETYDALAQRGNVPLSTMKTWIRRGLIALRGCLDR